METFIFSKEDICDRIDLLVKLEFYGDDMDIEFRKFTDYNRGIMYEILKDAYSFDERCAICWDENWRQSDAFFFDNPDIADKYGFITCYKGEPIGFICWDPRNRPQYVEIGHNGIRTKYKGKGFGKAQLSEAVRRIKEYEGLKEIRVWTNSNLIMKVLVLIYMIQKKITMRPLFQAIICIIKFSCNSIKE